MELNIALLLFTYLLISPCHLSAETNQSLQNHNEPLAQFEDEIFNNTAVIENNRNQKFAEAYRSKPWTTFIYASAILPVAVTIKLYFYDGNKRAAALTGPFAIMSSIWSVDGISRMNEDKGLNYHLLALTSLLNLYCVLGTGLHFIKQSLTINDFIKATLLQNLGIFIAFLVPYSIANVIDGR